MGSVSVTKDAPRQGGVPMTVSAKDLHVETSWETPHYTVQWPTLEGSGALSGKIDATVAAWRKDYGESAAGANADLTASWEPVLNAKGLKGVRLTSQATGADAYERSVTHYGDASHPWSSADLVAPEQRGRLVEALSKSVAAATHESVDAATTTPADVLTDVTFDAQGSLLIRIDEGALASMSQGRLYATVQTPQGFLSDAGTRVRDVAVAARPSGVSTPAESASETSTLPSPSEGSVPSTEPSSGAGDAKKPAVDCATAKCVALTFDDGPGPYTEQILDTLESKDARATFFMLGPAAQAAPDTLHRMVKLGMGLGDHSWTHPQFTNLTPAQVTSEITRQAAVVKEITGRSPVAVRPPYGAFDAKTPHAGYPFVLWDVDTEDWKNRSAAVTTQRALAGAHRGAIILMHDIQPSTAQALPGIVDGLKKQGYTLVTIDELLPHTDPSQSYRSAQ